MKATSGTAPNFPVSRLVLSFLYVAAFPVLLFALAGDWRWREGWIFSLIFFLGSYGTLLYLYFTDPALLNERYASPIQKEQKPWDKVLLLMFFLEFMVWFVIMPLDAKRYGWTVPFPPRITLPGTVLLLVSFYIIYRALHENTFAAPVVKMQRERGQQVVSTGPYAIVRHPMYSGAILLFISAPLLLSSYWGLAVGVLLIVTIAVRSLGEEAMLKDELPGYREYMQRVRWRMIPFVF